MTDPLHERSAPGVLWSTVNAEEALPGVPTPLGWTFWGEPSDSAARQAWADLGVLSRRVADRAPAGPLARTEDPFDQPLLGMFYGHCSLNVSFMRALADRLPGTSGDAIEEQLFGGRSEGARSVPIRTRYPAIAARLPVGAARLPARARRLRTSQHAWWLEATRPAATTDPAGAAQALTGAMDRLFAAQRLHGVARMLGQALIEQVRGLAEAAGHPGIELQLTTGYGTVEETQITVDLWNFAREQLPRGELLRRHGFHGPNEGELSSRSWREDDGPLQALAERYAALGEEESPQRLAERQTADRQAAEAKVLQSLPFRARRRGALVLRLTRTYIPLVEVTKGAYLRAIDGGRAAARLAGLALARDGILDPDDVFYLTTDEVTCGPPPDAADRVAFRRDRRAHHLTVQLPERWTGEPQPLPVGPSVPLRRDALQGIGASHGVAEGRARVVRDAAEIDSLEPGEILVCPFTDPSWAGVFHLARAVVIDVGGLMSHGAIVAREMGLPCVINTRLGTRAIQTGDRVRVDGTQGTVQLLGPEPSRAPGAG